MTPERIARCENRSEKCLELHLFRICARWPGNEDMQGLVIKSCALKGRIKNDGRDCGGVEEEPL